MFSPKVDFLDVVHFHVTITTGKKKRKEKKRKKIIQEQGSYRVEKNQLSSIKRKNASQTWTSLHD